MIIYRGERCCYKHTDQSRGVGQKSGSDGGVGFLKPGRGADSTAETALCGQLFRACWRREGDPHISALPASASFPAVKKSPHVRLQLHGAS